MKLTLTFVLAMLFCVGKTQTPSADLQQINTRYASATSLNLALNYQMFFDEESRAQESTTGFYRKQNNCYHMNQGGSEMLMTEQHLLLVDRATHKVILDRRRSSHVPKTPSLAQIDSVVHDYESVTAFRSGPKNQLQGYTFTLKESPFARISVVFDPGTHALQEICCVYRNKMDDGTGKLRTVTMKTLFSEQTTRQLSAAEFDVENYVKAGAKQLTLTRRLTGYTLLTKLRTL